MRACLTELVLSGLYYTQEMPRSKLFYYLFLLDYVAQVKIGCPITGLQWKKYHFSIYPDNRHDVQNVLDELINDVKLVKQEGPNYKLVNQKDVEKIVNNIKPEIRQIIEKVAKIVKEKTEQELLQLIQSLEGVRDVPCMHPIPLYRARLPRELE